MNNRLFIISNQFIKDIAWGPKRLVETWPIYFVNGYKFHTKEYSQMRKSNNNGVCIRGVAGVQVENDYYGYVDERLLVKKLVLFKCH